MAVRTTPTVYRELGVSRIINVMGTATLVGGSNLHSSVKEAFLDADGAYVDVEKLLEGAGRAIADLVGAEAAFVAPGCYAALVLSTAGILTGTDARRIAALPDTAGMPDQMLIQKRTRYHYDRCVTIAGGRLVEVGDEQGASAADFDAAIGTQTAGILYPVHLESTPHTLPLDEIIAIAQRRRVPILLDAAAQIYPVERITELAGCGADLVCISTKYMGGPSAGGFLCGRKAAVDAAAMNGFLAYESADNQCLGRGYKMDRHTIVAAVAAVREWFRTDHGVRLRDLHARADAIARGLDELPHVQVAKTLSAAWVRLEVTPDASALGKSAPDIQAELKKGDPPVWVNMGEDKLLLYVNTLDDGEEQIVADRLKGALGG